MNFYCEQQECDGIINCPDGTDKKSCTFFDKLPGNVETVMEFYIPKWEMKVNRHLYPNEPAQRIFFSLISSNSVEI